MTKKDKQELQRLIEQEDMIYEDAKQLIEKAVATRRLKNKLKAFIRKEGIIINIILDNLIEKYAKVYMITLDMEESIKTTGLMYEYTNKAGETNLTKNPIVSEYKAYNAQLNNISKTILDVVSPKVGPEGGSRIQGHLEKYKRK